MIVSASSRRVPRAAWRIASAGRTPSAAFAVATASVLAGRGASVPAALARPFGVRRLATRALSTSPPRKSSKGDHRQEDHQDRDGRQGVPNFSVYTLGLALVGLAGALLHLMQGNFGGSVSGADASNRIVDGETSKSGGHYAARNGYGGPGGVQFGAPSVVKKGTPIAIGDQKLVRCQFSKAGSVGNVRAYLITQGEQRKEGYYPLVENAGFGAVVEIPIFDDYGDEGKLTVTVNRLKA